MRLSKDFDAHYKRCKSHLVDDIGCFSYNKIAREVSGMGHDIGSKIKAARIEKKLTQEQVAELLGVSRQTISNWENGGRKIFCVYGEKSSLIRTRYV